MRHSSTRQLHAYWLRQRGGKPVPLRSAIEPADIAGLLGDMFILDTSGPDSAPFRLAGTRFCAGLGRELTGTDFLSLWRGADRQALRAALDAIGRDAATAVIEIAGRSERSQSLVAEMILLPMSQDEKRIDRILGLFAPLERPYWLGLHAIPHLEATGLHWLRPTETPSTEPTRASLPLTATPRSPARQPTPSTSQPVGRRHQHLVVLDGGRD